MKTIIKFAFILFCVNLVAATILASVYSLTRSRIALEQKVIQEDALKQVMPETVGERLEPVTQDDVIQYWKAYKGNSAGPAGYVFIAKKYGYSGVIESMVGIKKDGTITGVRVLSQNETPGLGAKIVEVLSERTIFTALKELFLKEKHKEELVLPHFTEQFKNRNVSDIEFSKAGIHAVTGATISSRAVVDSIKSKAMEILKTNE
jgi:electron transport complex protein RnfG